MTPLWYNEGLRFECTQCGACCSGAPGLVNFTEEEGAAMAAYLGIPEKEFLDRFAIHTEDGWALQERPADRIEHGHDCVFLERTEEGLALCRVHPERPLQCRTWPFWPGNLRNRRAWNRAAHECEGIGEGPIISRKEIDRQCRLTLAAENVPQPRD